MIDLFLSLLLQQEPTHVELPGTKPTGARIFLETAGLAQPRAMMISYNEALAKAKLCPKAFDGEHWKFPWHTDGYVRLGPADQQYNIRFRVFAQSHTDADFFSGKELKTSAARELLRLWEMDADYLGIDHAIDVNRRLVDVYLCDKGAPGGEQLFDTDTEADRQVKVNTIYIYDLASLTDNLEKAREVAHEYGHAVLPAIGGFKKPEYWANGYLGEKLYLRWLRNALLDGKLKPEDAMGATLEELDQFCVQSVNPLVKAGGKRAPSDPLFKSDSFAAMAAFEGVVLWADTIMPHKMLGRSLMLLNGKTALDYVNAAVVAAEEHEWEPKIPAYIMGPVWIPLGAAKLTGAEILKKDSGWVQIKPTGRVKITPPEDQSNL